MNLLKPLFLITSLFAFSIPSLAYHGDNSWHRGANQQSQQNDNRYCDNYRNYSYNGQHHGRPHYSVTVQTTQPDEILKKVTADVPKGDNSKQYRVHVTVSEVVPDTSTQGQ